MAVSAVPSLLVSVSLLFLPESPKFLLSKGREGESLNVLRMMFSANTGDHRYCVMMGGIGEYLALLYAGLSTQ